ncbi:hypothetical protein Pan216_13290 [Planctomycetes bacterium Pan216]|uniref:Uncharacterized protein n=1 Tax=Kolteria novifilia TaxID=2527975 RepID=A0A518B0H7_9BACT|nr:hypothetical protein Pan216_13290 [Planctomycetes bacterium Pan216]
MPRWADRARKAFKRSPSSFVAKTLEETVAEAKSVARDLQFIIESSGTGVDREIGYDDESLQLVERIYRTAARSPASIELGIDNFERLLSLYLGQSLVERDAGAWARYEGKEHVIFPITIRLRTGKHVDVFLFCKSLHQKQVNGTLSGRALTTFLADVDRLAFP